MRIWLSYAAAALVGIGTPLFALWVARGTAVGSDPAFAGAAVVIGLAIVSGLLSVAIPRHWMLIALIVSGPLCALGTVMFVALAQVDEFFWVWLWVALGGLAASLLCAYLVRRAKRA